MERNLKLIYSLILLNSITYGMIFTIVPLYARELGASIGEVGIIAASFPALQIILRVPLGILSDYIGRKKMLIIAFAGGAFAGTIFAFASTYWMLIPAQLTFGASVAIVWTSANSYLSERADTDKFIKKFGIFLLFSGIGFLIGPVWGSYAANEWSFELSFAIFAGISGAGFFLAFLLSGLNKKEGKKKVAEVFTEAYRAAKRIIVKKEITYAVGCVFLMGIMMGIYISYFPLYLEEVGFIGASLGVIVALRSVAWTALRPFADKYVKIFGRIGSIAIGIFIGAAVIIVVPFLESFSLLIIAGVVAGIAMAPVLPVVMAFISDHTRRTERGLGMGIYGTALTFGQFMSPILLGRIGEIFGSIRLPFLLAGTISIIGVLALLTHVQR